MLQVLRNLKPQRDFASCAPGRDPIPKGPPGPPSNIKMSDHMTGDAQPITQPNLSLATDPAQPNLSLATDPAQPITQPNLSLATDPAQTITQPHLSLATDPAQTITQPNLSLATDPAQTITQPNLSLATDPAQLNLSLATNELSRLFDISHKDALSSMKNKEDQAFLRDQRTERKMAMGGVDQELVRKETMRMKKLARKSEMAEKEKMAKAEKFATVDLSDSSSPSSGPSSQENSPFRGETSSQVSSSPKKRLKNTRSGLCAGQDEPLRPEGDPPPPGCGFQLRINACFPKHTSSIQNDDQDGACGGHQECVVCD
ncbi:hypothetical protein GWK47_053029 [Chionoecetes opilio]|uniref:Uncharacterized protein n=1 Tax=Chionoecetes opilio TaxID=41210 RepID=A0A8J4Y7G5_CHIOP|nr:hypothetical protein GWK47_053029 [Chionoecetes opilio]